MDDEQAAQGGELGVVEDGVEEPFGDGYQPILVNAEVGGQGGVGRVDRDAQGGGNLGHARVGPVDEGIEDRLLGGEVFVDRALAHADVAGQVADGCTAPAIPGESLQGCVEQPVPRRR